MSSFLARLRKGQAFPQSAAAEPPVFTQPLQGGRFRAKARRYDAASSLERVPFFAVLREIQALDFMLFRYTQAHDQVHNLKNDQCPHNR